MADVPVTLLNMDEDDYIITPEESWVIQALYRTIDAIYAGRVEAAGFCSVNPQGTSTFFFYNKPDDMVLQPALSRLVGIYDNRRQRIAINAPLANRSYEVH